MKAIALVVALALCASTSSLAQTCSVGIRCGNTCISREDICRTTTSGSGSRLSEGQIQAIIVVGVIFSVAAFAGLFLLAAQAPGTLQANADDEHDDLSAQVLGTSPEQCKMPDWQPPSTH